MTIVTDTWRQLVRRRLWPVALLLLAALAAVPFLLAKEPDVVPAPAVAPAPKATSAQAVVAQADPIVTLASAGEARRRRVLGSRKDPFEPAPLSRKQVAEQADTGTGGAPSAPAETPAGSGGGSTTPTLSGPVAPQVPSVEVPPKPTYPLYTLTVRFGDSTSDALERGKLKRLQALPGVEEPVLVYLGVREGGKVAVFMVDSTVQATGDGNCKPTYEVCETIELREGETEFFDVLGESGTVVAQYQLDLMDIKRKTTASAAKAKQSSKEGRALLKVRSSETGPLRYRFDAASGTVRKLGAKAWKAALAKAATAKASLGDTAE